MLLKLDFRHFIVTLRKKRKVLTTLKIVSLVTILYTTSAIWRFSTATTVFTVGARMRNLKVAWTRWKWSLPVHDSASGSSLDEDIGVTEWRLNNTKCTKTLRVTSASFAYLKRCKRSIDPVLTSAHDCLWEDIELQSCSNFSVWQVLGETLCKSNLLKCKLHKTEWSLGPVQLDLV